MKRLRLFFFSAAAVTAVGFAYIGAVVIGGNSEDDLAPVIRAEQDMASGTYTFLTWHNGSKTHDVWGIGSVYAGAWSGTVRCGDRSVTLTPIYNTGSDHHYPKSEENKNFAAAYNQAVLETFKARGISCDF